MSAERKAGKRRKSPASIFGLGGFLNFDTKKVMDTMKKVGFVCIGYLGGREIKRMVFKAGDEKGFKKFLGEILEVAGGVVLSTRNNEPMRYIGYGLMADGVISGVGKIMNKDIVQEGFLKGLEGFSLAGLLNGEYKEIPVYEKLPPLDGNQDREDLPPLDGNQERLLERAEEPIGQVVDAEFTEIE